MLAAEQPPPQRRKDDHRVSCDLTGQPEGRDQPLRPHPEPGACLVGDQLGEEGRQGSGTGPGQQLIQSDRVVHDDPQGHEQNPPHQPGADPPAGRDLTLAPPTLADPPPAQLLHRQIPVSSGTRGNFSCTVTAILPTGRWPSSRAAPG
jgi:hypothetical protein